MKAAASISLARAHRPHHSMQHLALPHWSILRRDGRVAALAVKPAPGRRRAVRATVTRATLSGQGPYAPDSGAGQPGPRRIVRLPRDVRKLVDILSGGAADDPELFLQLLTAAPQMRDPRPPRQQLETTDQARSRPDAEQYARQLEQARRRAQLEQEERQRWEALRAVMLRNARRHLPQYDAPAMARLASGLAYAGVRDPALCDEMLRQLMERRARQQQQPSQVVPEPGSLADLLDAFAMMRHRPTDAQIAELLRLQQKEQQQAAEQERMRQAQAQQILRSQPRLQPRGMIVPEAKPAPPADAGAREVGSSGRMSPEDSARLLGALSRLGYSPDEGTLTQLLEQLKPQRLQLQPADVQQQQRQQQQQQQPLGQVGRRAVSPPPGLTSQGRQAMPEAATTAAVRKLGPQEVKEEGEQAEDDNTQSREVQDEVSYILHMEAIASAVRALERMGRPDQARQLREHYMRDLQARVAREREARRQQEIAAAAAAAERERERRAAEAALREREREREMQQRLREASEIRRHWQEEQAGALRLQLTRQLQAADHWQQIRALLFTYQEALDANCLVAAAAQLAELLVAARRTVRGLAMTLRERGELGDLLEWLGQLVLRRLDGASAAQAASLLTSVVRMRHLEEGLLVGLLRRVRDTLGEAGGGELTAVLRVLAECGVRPSKPWMETFLGRCEELLEQFSAEDLAELPVSLAQLGAHPGRSFLGTYLDVLQEREGELSQSAVSEAVRAVALLDRPFLSAWRQAAAARQQQKQQAQQQEQQQARAAAAATAATATQQQQEETRRMEQQQKQQPASALASVDEMLARPDVVQQEQRDGAVHEDSLPLMHPKQRSMAQTDADASGGRQHQQQLQPDQRIQLTTQSGSGPEAVPGTTSGLDRRPEALAMQSIELDVDTANLPYGDGDVPGSTSGTSSPTELATTAAGAAAAPAPSGGRQLPGSCSVDGYYNPEPYDEYVWDEEVDEGEYVDLELDEEEAATRPIHASDASMDEGAASPSATGTAAAREQNAEGKRAAGVIGEQQQEGQHLAKQEQPLQADAVPERKPSPPPQQPQTTPERQPTPEDIAQARALRSLLLERYEAVEAYRDWVERGPRLADGGGGPLILPPEMVATGGVREAQERLQRLQADFDNFKRRASAEREQLVVRVKADALRPILAVADNFERAAIQIKPKTDGERAVQDAYQTVYNELKEFLKKEGLQEVGVEGEAFDPNQHEAVMREDRNDVDDGTVTGVFQRGYRLGEVLVRPALVKVAYN